jgi:hypothetical protein
MKAVTLFLTIAIASVAGCSSSKVSQERPSLTQLPCTKSSECPPGMSCFAVGYCLKIPPGPCSNDMPCLMGDTCIQNLKKDCPDCPYDTGCVWFPPDGGDAGSNTDDGSTSSDALQKHQGSHE